MTVQNTTIQIDVNRARRYTPKCRKDVHINIGPYQEGFLCASIMGFITDMHTHKQMAKTASNNNENVFWVLGRVPMVTFDMNMKTYIFAHSGVISLVYLFVCMHISYKAHNRCTKETFLIRSDVDVNIFSALRSIPSDIIDINLKSCVLNRHKLRQSQIATLPSQFVICRNL